MFSIRFNIFSLNSSESLWRWILVFCLFDLKFKFWTKSFISTFTANKWFIDEIATLAWVFVIQNVCVVLDNMSWFPTQINQSPELPRKWFSFGIKWLFLLHWIRGSSIIFRHFDIFTAFQNASTNPKIYDCCNFSHFQCSP